MAAVDVYTLLSLPASKAFSAFRTSDFPVDEAPRSASPPRKIARLAVDSDSASASRSRGAAAAAGQPADGPASLVLRLQGNPIKAKPDSVYDRDFKLLRHTIRVALARGTGEPLPATYERIYSACQAVVCDAKKGEGIYDNIKLEIERCCGRLFDELHNSACTGIEWLEPLKQVCEWYDKQVTLLKSLFAYLDRVYLVWQKKQDIGSLAYDGFMKAIFYNAAIVSRIRGAIDQWVTVERTESENKHSTDHPLRDLIPALVKQLQRYGLYQELLESFYLKQTHEFYEAESKRLRETLQASAFVVHVKNRDDQEYQRAQALLPAPTAGKVSLETTTALLGLHMDWIATEAIPQLFIDEPKVEYLGSLYKLFTKAGGVKLAIAAFKLHVKNRVAAIVKNAAYDDHMVENLLLLKGHCDAVVKNAFVDEVPISRATPSRPSGSQAADDGERVERVVNRQCEYAVQDAFQEGFKARRNKPAEMIAKYLDKAMRRGQKGKDDRAYSADLEAALSLYRFTDDKDVFRAFYRRALAKRLLLDKSASDDYEKTVLRKLKEEYDPEFEDCSYMFTDLALSRDLTAEYRGKRGGDAKLSVMILQRSVWPFTVRTKDAALPVWMTDELNKFTRFYKEKHTSHKLDWDHALGTVTMRANFKAGAKELSVSLYQAIILLLFNETEEIPFNEVKTQTSLEDGELRRTLQSLACGKKRVLRKQPPGKDVNDGDVFFFNADFTDPAFRVHINSIQVKETPEESKRAQTMIEGDRKLALDAAIVRIMKGKKKTTFEQLKNQTVSAVSKHFLPEVSVIKARIDGLVEQEYIRRDEDDMTVLHYVA